MLYEVITGANNIVQTALDAFDKLDILVNNAGILRDKSFSKMDEQMWDIVIAVHLRGTYCVTHAAYNHMKDRGQGGVIINTSSTSGLNGVITSYSIHYTKLYDRVLGRRAPAVARGPPPSRAHSIDNPPS